MVTTERSARGNSEPEVTASRAAASLLPRLDVKRSTGEAAWAKPESHVTAVTLNEIACATNGAETVNQAYQCCRKQVKKISKRNNGSGRFSGSFRDKWIKGTAADIAATSEVQ